MTSTGGSAGVGYCAVHSIDGSNDRVLSWIVYADGVQHGTKQADQVFFTEVDALLDRGKRLQERKKNIQGEIDAVLARLDELQRYAE